MKAKTTKQALMGKRILVVGRTPKEEKHMCRVLAEAGAETYMMSQAEDDLRVGGIFV